MYVSFLVVVFTSCLCLICESDSRDSLSGRAPKQRSRALQGEAGGVLGPSRNCSLETAPGAFFPFITHIIVDFRNKDITLENQDSTKVILQFQISLTLLFKAKWISMSVFIPAFSCSRESLIPTLPLGKGTLYLPTFIRQGRKAISFPYGSTNITGNWKIPCVWGLGFFHENLYLCRERGEPFKEPTKTLMCFPCGSVVKKLPANAGDAGLIPGSGRSPGKGNGSTLQHSCLGNPMDRGSWWATVHGVTKELDMT